MRVEAREATRAPQGKNRVRVDNGVSLLMPASALAELGLYEGMEVPESAMASIEDTCAKASARERAVRIVSASAVSQRELELRLVQKGEREEDAKEAVQWLTELKLLDDRKTAESIVRSGAAKGYGTARIRQMLYEKRMPVQDEAIDACLQRRFRGKTPDRAECKRATDALLRRGHRWSDIRRALERYAPDEEFFED